MCQSRLCSTLPAIRPLQAHVSPNVRSDEFRRNRGCAVVDPPLGVRRSAARHQGGRRPSHGPSPGCGPGSPITNGEKRRQAHPDLGPARRAATESPVRPAEPAPIRPTVLPRLHLGAAPVIEDLAATLERAVEAQDTDWESRSAIRRRSSPNRNGPRMAGPSSPSDVIADVLAEELFDSNQPRCRSRHHRLLGPTGPR